MAKGTLTISDIKRLSFNESPYFFSPKTLKFFRQTVSSFKVKKIDDNYFLISAPMKDSSGKLVGRTERVFERNTGKLLNLTTFLNRLK